MKKSFKKIGLLLFLGVYGINTLFASEKSVLKALNQSGISSQDRRNIELAAQKAALEYVNTITTPTGDTETLEEKGKDIMRSYFQKALKTPDGFETFLLPFFEKINESYKQQSKTLQSSLKTFINTDAAEILAGQMKNNQKKLKEIYLGFEKVRTTIRNSDKSTEKSQMFENDSRFYANKYFEKDLIETAKFPAKKKWSERLLDFWKNPSRQSLKDIFGSNNTQKTPSQPEPDKTTIEKLINEIKYTNKNHTEAIQELAEIARKNGWIRFDGNGRIFITNNEIRKVYDENLLTDPSYKKAFDDIVRGKTSSNTSDASGGKGSKGHLTQNAGNTTSSSDNTNKKPDYNSMTDEALLNLFFDNTRTDHIFVLAVLNERINKKETTKEDIMKIARENFPKENLRGLNYGLTTKEGTVTNKGQGYSGNQTTPRKGPQRDHEGPRNGGSEGEGGRGAYEPRGRE